LWGVSESGSSDIDDPLVSFDFGVFLGDLVEDFDEQAIGVLHDVVLDEAGDLLSLVLSGVLESITDDLVASWASDELQALNHIVGLSVLDSGVEIFLVFSDDHDVHVGVLGGDERSVAVAWSDVGVETQGLTDGHVQALVASSSVRVH